MRKGKPARLLTLATYSFLSLLQCSFVARDGPLKKSPQPEPHGFAGKGWFSSVVFLHFSHSSEDEILTSAEEQGFHGQDLRQMHSNTWFCLHQHPNLTPVVHAWLFKHNDGFHCWYRSEWKDITAWHKPLYPTASVEVVNPRSTVPTMYSGAESKAVQFWKIWGQLSKWQDWNATLSWSSWASHLRSFVSYLHFQ